jgi:hypothetical protein
VRKAALSGERLAAKTAAAIHIYDAGTGDLSIRLPASSPVTLEDLDRDILSRRRVEQSSCRGSATAGRSPSAPAESPTRSSNRPVSSSPAPAA